MDTKSLRHLIGRLFPPVLKPLVIDQGSESLTLQSTEKIYSKKLLKEYFVLQRLYELWHHFKDRLEHDRAPIDLHPTSISTIHSIRNALFMPDTKLSTSSKMALRRGENLWFLAKKLAKFFYLERKLLVVIGIEPAATTLTKIVAIHRFFNLLWVS